MTIEKSVLTEDNYNQLGRLFKSEQDYREIMQALWKTRSGLFRILEERPEMEEDIAPQFQTLNLMIGALLNDNLPHPIFSEPSTPAKIQILKYNLINGLLIKNN